MFIKGIVQLFKILHIKERTAEHFSYGEGVGGIPHKEAKDMLLSALF